MTYRQIDDLARAGRAYDRLLEPVCRRWALTRNELDVLLFLANNPEYDRAVDVVRGRGLSKSHVSLSVANLERRGLLLGQKDPRDRRTVHLHLTGAATEPVLAGQAAQKQFYDRLVAGITPRELEQMRLIAAKMSGNIRTMVEAEK